MLLRLFFMLKALPKRLAVASGPILRLLAALCLLAALITLTSDWVLSRPSTSTAGYWQVIAPNSYANAGKAVSRVLGQWVWSPLISSVLAIPAYMMFGLLALGLGWVGRRRRRVSVYLN